MAWAAWHGHGVATTAAARKRAHVSRAAAAHGTVYRALGCNDGMHEQGSSGARLCLLCASVQGVHCAIQWDISIMGCSILQQRKLVMHG